MNWRCIIINHSAPHWGCFGIPEAREDKIMALGSAFCANTPKKILYYIIYTMAEKVSIIANLTISIVGPVRPWEGQVKPGIVGVSWEVRDGNNILWFNLNYIGLSGGNLRRKVNLDTVSHFPDNPANLESYFPFLLALQMLRHIYVFNIRRVLKKTRRKRNFSCSK